MKESFYNIKFQHNGLNFIYNTKNSKLITFDNYDNLFANHYSYLVSNGFLVTDDFNEFEEVVNKRSEYLLKEKDYKRFTILPTTKCNANCSFCYENDSPRYDMSDEVVEQTINFIKQESQEKKKIRVYWFGGEPLVRRDIVDKISKSLIEFSNENGISYQASIATNLSLLDKDDIEYAIKNWHLNKIEFAFDGNKEQHNKSKDYKIKNFDAFQHNLDMIDCLLNKNIIVQIRFNITRENFNDAMLLVQEILKKHHGNKNLLLYLGVVFKTPKNQNLTKEELIEMRQIGNYSIEFFKLLKKYNHIQGVNGLPLTYKKNNCYASNDDSLVIGPAGIITKCQMCPDDELNKIGDIYSGIDFSSKNYNIWYNTLYFDKCQKCKLYPMCLSGCIGQKYIYNENTCCKEKFYLDELLKTAVDMLDEDKQLIKNRVLSLKR